jgi:hypothetical protein
MPRILFLAATTALLIAATTRTDEPPTEPSALDRDVATFLKKHCVAWHGVEKPKGDIRFDGPARILPACPQTLSRVSFFRGS